MDGGVVQGGKRKVDPAKDQDLLCLDNSQDAFTVDNNLGSILHDDSNAIMVNNGASTSQNEIFRAGTTFENVDHR